MNLVDLMWTGVEVGFVALIIGLAAIGNRLSLESRAAALQRRDPGTAAALRQAQAVSDHAYGVAQWIPEVIIVCTPSRRAAFASDDEAIAQADPRVAPRPEAAQAAVVTRRVLELPASADRHAKHLARRTYRVSRVSGRGPATRRQRADTPRTRRYRVERAR
ncbi:hypothetical protein WDJ51_08125 [Rathayibacter sp. YIM 133350]|uniref:hypothetical protein n=1 Tax=Rathayibacter sp. YIM 133350 TaxID=3131992 RepID=UPI00307CD563